MTLLKLVATLICPILIVADIRIERIPRGYKPRMLPLHSSAILFYWIIYLEKIGNHTTRTVAQLPTHIRRGVQYEYVPILEMIFRNVLFKNASTQGDHKG